MKKAFVIVDVQNDFVSGSLGFDGATDVVEAIVNKLDAQPDVPCFVTQDTHTLNYLQTHEGKKLPILHCVKDTPGWEIVDALKPYRNRFVKVYEKPTFPSLQLAIDLSSETFDVIEIMGLVSNICVLSQVVMVRAALPNATIYVDRTCTASFDEDLNLKTFDILNGIHTDIL